MVSFEVPLIVNGRIYGSSYVLASTEGSVYFIKEVILQTLSDLLNDAYTEKLSLNMKELVFFERFEIEKEISLTFNDIDQLIEVIVDPTLIKLQTNRCCIQGEGYNFDDLVPVADWSGFLNLRYGKGLGYVYLPEFQTSYLPHHMLSDFAIQHDDWVFTGALSTNFQQPKFDNLGSLLWIKDSISEDRRIFIGEFAPDTIGNQYVPNMLGIAFMPSPYTNLTTRCQSEGVASRDSPSFFLTYPSKVDVIINGFLYDTLDLNAGPHQLADLPVRTGNNNVQFRIHEAQEGAQIISSNYFYDTTLLEPGEIDYFSSAGVLENYYNNRVGWGFPLYSGYFLYGVNQNYTSGTYLSLTKKICQFGIENRMLIGNRFRVLLDIGTSWFFESTPEPSVQLSIENITTDESPTYWNLYVNYLGDKYLSNHQMRSYQDYYDYNNQVLLTASFNVSRTFFDNISCSLTYACSQANPKGSKYLNHRAKMKRKRKSNFYSGINGAVSMPVTRNIGASICFYSTSMTPTQRYEQGILLTFNWSYNQNINGAIYYDSFRDYLTNRVNYSKQLDTNSTINANAAIQTKGRHNTFLGAVNYIGERMEAHLSNDAVFKISQNDREYYGRTSFMLGTSLCYADGAWGISRPIFDSFAIVKTYGDLQASNVRINPRNDDEYAAQSRGPLPAVFPYLSAYTPNELTVVPKGDQFGYELDKTFFTCYPKFKSGTLIKLKRHRIYFVEGVLVDSAGLPMSCQCGWIKSEGEQVILPFFTNREGEFQFIGEDPGVFELTLPSQKGSRYVIKISENDEPGVLDLGTITLR